MTSMKIIQFLCPNSQLVEPVKAVVLQVANEMSVLRYRAEDPEYVTRPFGMDQWREHLETPGLWWANYGEIYKHLGDVGRRLADRFFGFDPMHGILRHAPLLLAYPDMRLQILDVQDPVAQGYLPPPVANMP